MSTTWPPGAVWIVIPTYNEAENIDEMTRTLLRVIDGEQLDAHILVVDDGSPDGTADLVDRVHADDARVEVLRRTAKEGIGPAYLAGFRLALDRGAALIVEMDADFSHNPHDVPRLIAAAEHADLVLGSRYVTGGGVARWGPLRRIISRAGSAYARGVLGLRERDLTGGFKCFRREVLEALPFDEVAAAGYVFQIEMTYRAILAGFTVREIPITFTERIRGASKMGGGIVKEAAIRIPQLRRLRREAAQRGVAPRRITG